MPITINTNSAATEATFNLSKANDNLRRSIARLSSGNRITKPTDDAGGLAVAYKLQSSVKRWKLLLITTKMHCLSCRCKMECSRRWETLSTGWPSCAPWLRM